MIDYMHVLARQMLDEVELSLTTAYLLFSDSFNVEPEDWELMNADKNKALVINKERHEMHKATQKLFLKYQTVKNGPNSMVNNLRAMSVLITLAELSGVVAHFYL